MAHHMANTFTHIGFVAMNGAFDTGRFIGAELTILETVGGIVIERFAVVAKSANRTMIIGTGHPDHCRHRFHFGLNRFGDFHLGHCLKKTTSNFTGIFRT